MQKINYKEKILLEDEINELIMINIDDKLSQTKESDCIKIAGEIKVSGEVKTNSGNKNFIHPIGVDIMLSKEQLANDEVNVHIDDFNYQIDNKAINIDLIMKIDGLKEIEAYFPAQENQENIEVNSEENREEIIQENQNEIVEANDPIESIEVEEITQEISKEEVRNEKYSLLSQIFKNRSLKKESAYLLHVVKEESTYEQIASLYNIEVNKIKSANNDEEIYKGKLIFIPKS